MAYRDPPHQIKENTNSPEFIALINIWRKELMSNVYPVGAVYTSVVSTSPATLFGGTWEAFGSGTVLVGLDSGDTDFDTVEETGGAKTHTLIEAELPEHNHSINNKASATTFSTPGSNAPSQTGGGRSWNVISDSILSTNNTGSDTAHNNVQPYTVVYFWKRTA